MSSKIALVTGSSRGIGRGIARRLAADGVLVGVHYGFDETAAKQTVDDITAAGGRAFTVHAELGVPGDAETLWANFDARLAALGAEGLDILVNNAGANGPGPIGEATADGFDRAIALNLRAPFLITQGGLTRMRDGGRVVNISSGAAILPWAQDPVYGMTKAALDHFTKSLAKELGPRGITVNSVGPGVIDTDINASWLRASDEGRAAGAAYSAFGRVGEVEDVADVVGFLASDAGRWVTGSWLDATGGSLL
ncbi:SDR family NAD(P)-dependent oxidoreductase [Phytomonospora endophytica]|uniref:3-oxoacyl-[acyl-carrier protein] reductase n=1 Tax=Phytomonospora endophytica TaxID=714109 RepID=A0A841FXL8_9ACTN|nr:SDR family oxidoreductase [Phytomonospora endophytica]MBB6037209.1 3-oxoacyl-[acyl-carrier protein] reductase [Phytomonospora endophytica]GIG71290.1 short-chain dehydrogenase [Phytomonospora endophytica]